MRVGDFWNCESFRIHSDFAVDHGIWFIVLGYVAKSDIFSVRTFFYQNFVNVDCVQMFLGVYYDDAFELPVLTRHHALSVTLNLAKKTLHNVLQYDAVDGHITNYLDADNLHIRNTVSAHISCFRVLATHQHSSLRCVSLTEFAKICASLIPTQARTRCLHYSTQAPALSSMLHPTSSTLFEHSFTVLDDFNKFTEDNS